jgi:hypothetical protein
VPTAKARAISKGYLCRLPTGFGQLAKLGSRQAVDTSCWAETVPVTVFFADCPAVWQLAKIFFVFFSLPYESRSCTFDVTTCSKLPQIFS